MGDFPHLGCFWPAVRKSVDKLTGGVVFGGMKDRFLKGSKARLVRDRGSEKAKIEELPAYVLAKLGVERVLRAGGRQRFSDHIRETYFRIPNWVFTLDPGGGYPRFTGKGRPKGMGPNMLMT